MLEIPKECMSLARYYTRWFEAATLLYLMSGHAIEDPLYTILKLFKLLAEIHWMG